MLTQNTVWEGDVVVEGLVEVDAGVTLELLPGVRIQFSAPINESGVLTGLVIYGTLKAFGKADNIIRLFGSEPKPGQWQGVVFKETKGEPSRMTYCRIEDAGKGIDGQHASLIAEQLEVVGNQVGIAVGEGFSLALVKSRIVDNQIGFNFRQNSDASVNGSLIESNHEAGLVLQNSSPIIKGNVISDNGPVGVSCYRGSSPIIADNQIRNHATGIVVEMMSNPEIGHNDIHSNQTGISLGRMTFPKIEYNLIRDNDVGLFCNFSGYPVIHYNSFAGNRTYALDLGPKQSAAVSLKGPFEARNGEFAERVGPLRLRKFDTVAGETLHVPANGLIQASDNWWGSQVQKEMFGNGADANISVIEDCYDQKTLTFRDEAYERDCFKYSPWLAGPVAGVGPRPLN
jgi:parallel beta-helix repeat protein